jgi:hypothetical protein
MSESELGRLRRDLNVIEEAAGLSLPFAWREVWLCLGMVPCGLIILIWAALGPWDYIIISLAPLVLHALIALGFEVAQYRRDGGSRHLTYEWISSGVVALGFALLILWEKWLKLPAMPVRGAAFIIAGIMCFVISLSSRQRRVAVAATMALVPFGIALPLCTQQQVTIVGGIAVSVAGIAAAGILAGQLREETKQS